MEDRVLEGFVKNFSEATGISGLDPGAIFEAFVASAILRKYHQSELEEESLVGGYADGGIDALAILVNGHPVKVREDIEFFVDKLRRLDVEFVFIQAKSSPRFNTSDIGNFIYGVERFFSRSPDPPLKTEIKHYAELMTYIFEKSASMRENPKCYLYYVTTGVWTNAPEPSGRLRGAKDRLERLNLFSDVYAIPVDSNVLKEIYRQLERGVEREIELTKSTVFPRIDGVDEAYIGLLPGDQFIKLVSTDDGALNSDLFYDNVRDYQGNNPVNLEIESTLSKDDLRRTFPLLNNGVTIVANSIDRRGDTFRISGFQIVNGCQTTHILSQNRRIVDENLYIPIKLVATGDSQIVTDVIKATNRQTAVLPEALESLTPFHKELEDFYRIQESSVPVDQRVYYERRSKQYSTSNIRQSNIVNLPRQTTSFVAMFLDEPHSHPRYYGELLKSYEGRLFGDDHDPAPYYASGIASLLVERFLNSLDDYREFRSFRHHMLMIIRMLIGGVGVPKLNSRRISNYSLNLVRGIRDPNVGFQTCNEALERIKSTFTSFPKGNVHPSRLKAFTEKLTSEYRSAQGNANADGVDSVVSTSDIQYGNVLWYDQWKCYGFIKQDDGNDIFVHESELSAVPWHLRVPGTRVSFKKRLNTRQSHSRRLVAVQVMFYDEVQK